MSADSTIFHMLRDFIKLPINFWECSSKSPNMVISPLNCCFLYVFLGSVRSISICNCYIFIINWPLYHLKFLVSKPTLILMYQSRSLKVTVDGIFPYFHFLFASQSKKYVCLWIHGWFLFLHPSWQLLSSSTFSEMTGVRKLTAAILQMPLNVSNLFYFPVPPSVF